MKNGDYISRPYHLPLRLSQLRDGVHWEPHSRASTSAEFQQRVTTLNPRNTVGHTSVTIQVGIEKYATHSPIHCFKHCRRESVAYFSIQTWIVTIVWSTMFLGFSVVTLWWKSADVEALLCGAQPASLSISLWSDAGTSTNTNSNSDGMTRPESSTSCSVYWSCW